MKRIFANWWFLSLTALLLAILIFAVGLPLFVRALHPLWVRLGIGALLVAIWGLFAFLRRRKARKAEAALAAELAGHDKASEEANVLAGRMREALARLREAGGKSRNYLYSRPWYVIIGSPGAGKTTALLKSGLRFPFSQESLGGTGGTRNLDFLFADEAVLLDTAGRYTTQDSDSEVDRKGWTSLLGLLRKHRPLEPVNGIFVAIAADDLLRGDVVAIDRHAAIVRHRLHEIREALEAQLPVYLLLTKSDLIAGFAEYFADLDVDGRRAVLGHSFTWGEPLDSAAVTRAIDSVTGQVSARQAKRLHEEPDYRRRGLILGFPAQLRELRAPLHRFIEGAFLAEDRPSGKLRGVYLTSGTQDGSSLDRILKTVSQAYAMEDAAAAGGMGEGRAFFLNRLLHDVVFKEAGLPEPDRKAQARLRTMLTGACAGIAAIALVMVALWTTSFLGNRSFQADTAKAAQNAAGEIAGARLDLVRVGSSDTSIEDSLATLDALRDLPEGYAARQAGGPSLFRRFGLFQSDLSQRNEEAYRTGLRRILLPRLLLRLEEMVGANLAQPVQLYEPFKTYMILGGQAPSGAFDAKSVQRFIERDWADNQYPGVEMRPTRERLAKHLAALLEQPERINLNWQGQRGPVDAGLVGGARASLAQLSMADRAYAVMVEKAANPARDWRPGKDLRDGEAAAFAAPDLVMDQRVPYFFTRDGFIEAYAVRLATVHTDLKKELWVLGEDAETGSAVQEMASLRGQISHRYVQDYIAAWEGVVASLKPADYFNDPAAYRAFTKTPSPLKQVLGAVRHHTAFEGGAAKAVTKMASDKLQSTRAGRLASEIGGGGQSADQIIASHFAELNQWVGKGGKAPIDEFIDGVRKAYNDVLVARAPGVSNSSDTVAQAMAPILRAALEVPAIMAPFATEISQGGSAVQLNAAQSEVAQYFQQSVLPSCQSAIDDRYPFAGQALADAGITETRTAFGPGGSIDMFVRDKLDPYLDKGSGYWRWRGDNPVAQAFNPASPEAFQRAAALRNVLGEGLPLEIALTDKGAKVSRVTLNASGLRMEFGGAGDDGEQSLVWQLGGGMARTSEIVIYGNNGGAEEILWRHRKEGPWSLLRVFDRANVTNDGEGRVKAVFNRGAGEAGFSVSFPAEANPFGGGGLWSVKCPATL
ncbi:MAG TPA: type VI secretion system membrane subunit TssM [Sphingopyxis sp.]|nr:type VI secretion system membrane subunit TssM [Sphingopyxis sp.]HMP44756.1 type VI secretion system membrane subunit TssM [Sphingopyxis sp.]HMQ19655.1 type VI secretion system membrane subunit TssM [Sphingopyxis sp.]